MYYVIGKNEKFVRVETQRWMSERDYGLKAVAIIHGLDMTENPNIFRTKEDAEEMLGLLVESKDILSYRNADVVDSIIDGNGNFIDVAELMIYKINVEAIETL